MEQLTDPNDPRLDPFRAIRVNERALRREGLVLVESPQPVRRAIERGHDIVSLAVTPATLPLLDDARLPTVTYLVEQDVLDDAVGFNLHRGVLAIVRPAPPRSPAAVLAGASVVLILEGLNDAENLGVLFRTAAGLGADGVLLCPHCADPHSRRSTRVSIGTTLDVPFARLDPWPDALGGVAGAGFEIVALTPAGDHVLGANVLGAHVLGNHVLGDHVLGNHVLGAGPPAPRTALLLGAEGPGLSSAAVAAATRTVRIPMASEVDSLNVATAAALALWSTTLGHGIRSDAAR